jgi:hypothetical protein
MMMMKLTGRMNYDDMWWWWWWGGHLATCGLGAMAVSAVALRKAAVAAACRKSPGRVQTNVGRSCRVAFCSCVYVLPGN